MFKAALVLFVCLGLSSSIVLSTINESNSIFGFDSIVLCAMIAFLVQWIVFIPSYIKQTEKYYDLAGSLSFVLITLIALFSNPEITEYQLLISFMVVCWACRLGAFLFLRIKETGRDDRFEQLKKNKYTFFIAWTIQGLWVFLTSSPALVTLTSSNFNDFSSLVLLGTTLWALGFIIEIIADHQKLQFKKNTEKKFISTGLWRYSRHPNYFGEILLWIGLTIAILPAISDWQYVVIISPIFVLTLLTKVSGVPMLEAKADRKWGNDEEYQNYKKNTPTLIFRFKK